VLSLELRLLFFTGVLRLVKIGEGNSLDFDTFFSFTESLYGIQKSNKNEMDIISKA